MSGGEQMNQVTVYTSATCSYCQQAKAFLNENGVQYTERDVSVDRGAQKALEDMGAMGVPVIVVGTEIIRGFDKGRLEALFGKLIVECPECRQKLRLPRNKGTLKVTCKMCQAAFKVNSNRD
jgi:LSD1 subclass zinc finger protein